MKLLEFLERMWEFSWFRVFTCVGGKRKVLDLIRGEGWVIVFFGKLGLVRDYICRKVVKKILNVFFY